MSKFTPGPWTPHRFSIDYISIFGGEVGCIARVSSSINTNDPEKEDANAYLIAAAPDMYAALEVLLHEQNGSFRNMLSPALLPPPSKAMIKAEAALAKARGEE